MGLQDLVPPRVMSEDIYISPGDRWEQERHLPQRLHDQEKSYSPSLKSLGGIIPAPERKREPEQREYEDWELKEKCDLQKKLYNAAIEKYKNGEGTAEQVNETIRDINSYFPSFGCPVIPEFVPAPPIFAAKR